MPAPARAKEPPIETLPLEERIRRRAYELYWTVVTNQARSLMIGSKPKKRFCKLKKKPAPTKAELQ